MKPTGRLDLTVWLILLLGLVTTALGVAYGVATAPAGSASAGSVPETIVAAIVGSLGAGVVGAALSMVIARSADREGHDDLVARLARTLGARFGSEEADLQLLRADWHHYHVTAIDGRYVWRYQLLRLRRPTGTGALQGRVEVGDGRGHVFEYRVEAGVRGSQAILLFTSPDAGTGSESTEVFPELLTNGYRPHHCGIGVFHTWDGNASVGRVVMGRGPLVPAGPDGTVADEHQARLDEVWEGLPGTRRARTGRADRGRRLSRRCVAARRSAGRPGRTTR